MTVPRLNRRLVLEEPQRVADGAGGFVTQWEPLGTLWAEVSTRSGREREGGGAPVAAVAYRIVVRAVPVGNDARPRPEQRFRDGMRVFHIRAVAERDGDARYLVCFSDEEVVA